MWISLGNMDVFIVLIFQPESMGDLSSVNVLQFLSLVSRVSLWMSFTFWVRLIPSWFCLLVSVFTLELL